ncbi:MAG: hypothetical protein NC299_18340, partial [Lachnospiraceae bacterium]|nr:hypothetical protein [Lachnospiraceae bacterium]
RPAYFREVAVIETHRVFADFVDQFQPMLQLTCCISACLLQDSNEYDKADYRTVLKQQPLAKRNRRGVIRSTYFRNMTLLLVEIHKDAKRRTFVLCDMSNK